MVMVDEQREIKSIGERKQSIILLHDFSVYNSMLGDGRRGAVGGGVKE